jgi:hypothetical protein
MTMYSRMCWIFTGRRRMDGIVLTAIFVETEGLNV